MFEKVNPAHPDKIADRIAGAVVDLAYTKEENPKVAVEVLDAGYNCNVVIETSAPIWYEEVADIVRRISPTSINIQVQIRKQDPILAKNQDGKIRCGDNGIFRGVPITIEERKLTNIARMLYNKFPTDGKYILDNGRLVICQSRAERPAIQALFPYAEINPLGYWKGGPDVDTGATNRKLGSDMGGSVTGGGLHGKDLSKADVSINIYAWLKAQETKKPVELSCAIGDETVDGRPYEEIVEIARDYIKKIGGFEKFAEWGLLRYGMDDLLISKENWTANKKL